MVIAAICIDAAHVVCLWSCGVFLDYGIGRFTVKLGQYQNIGRLAGLSIAFAVLLASLYPFMVDLSSFLRWGHWSLSGTFKTLLSGFLGGD